MHNLSCAAVSVYAPFSNVHAFGLQASIARGLAYAPYADMLWMETSTPSLEEAKEFADAIHAKYPGIMYTLSKDFSCF